MTDTQVRDEAMTMFLTAADTTSLALTWTWYLLAQHADAESRLHSEIDAVLNGKPPTIDDVERLPWTRMVFAESLRLYPPIYAIAREAVEPFQVGGYTVPSGTLVLVSPYLLQRDPRYHSHSDRFEPQRWDTETADPRPPFTFFPFGSGPRGCIGQAYAMQEGILVLATLAQHWRMRMAPGHVVAIRPLINLRPASDMPMILERRHPP